MRRSGVLLVLALLVALPAQAGLVRVEIAGIVDDNRISTPSVSFNRDVVRSGDPFVISFLVDSENYRDSVGFPTRGYVIDVASYSMTFHTESGPLVEPLADIPLKIPYFVIRNDDPAVDGFFTSTNNVVYPVEDLHLDEAAVSNPLYSQHFLVTYGMERLPSLDIYDAVGTYDYTGDFRSVEAAVYDVTYDRPDMLLTFIRMTISRVPVEVPVDVKPGSCPNPFNLKTAGVLPVAILGTAALDVTTLDPASIRLNGVPPLRSALEDVGTPFYPFVGKEDCARDCLAGRPDGFVDLSLKFDSQAIAATLGNPRDGVCTPLQLTGNFVLAVDDGAPIVGQDVVRILNKGGGRGAAPGADRLSAPASRAKACRAAR